MVRRTIVLKGRFPDLYDVVSCGTGSIFLFQVFRPRNKLPLSFSGTQLLRAEGTGTAGVGSVSYFERSVYVRPDDFPDAPI